MEWRVIIGEHDSRTAARLKRALDGTRTVRAWVAQDGHAAFRAAFERAPDLLVLDTALPGPGGIVLCRALRQRERTSRLPVLLISDNTTETGRLQGLTAGADDYLAQPINLEEFRLRVAAILRRSPVESRPRIERYRIGALNADFAGVHIEVDGEAVALTRREFDLLRYLIEHRDRVLSHAVIRRDVWYGKALPSGTRAVTLTVARLRAKLGSAGRAHIETAIGRGYRFTTDGERAPCPTT